MIRKMLVIAAAVAMPVSVVAATAGTAGAGAPKVNATDYTVTCTGITAKADFSPALTTAGGASSNEKTSISGKASGCTATPNGGGTPITVSGATLKGTINNATSTHTCGGLTSPTTETGSLSIKWKTNPKLTDTTSVVNPTTVTGGVGADLHATFQLAFGTATSGPFQGTDSGVSSSTNAETTIGISAIETACNGKGLKSVSIVANTNPGAGAAITAS